jgi:hypothetical protein
MEASENTDIGTVSIPVTYSSSLANLVQIQ